jgi:hypothetical protein
MNKNILIRDLTAEQNERLALLQKKFGVKTNSQALLLLLRYCVVLDDELTDLMEMYENLGRTCFCAMKELEKSGQDFSVVECLLKMSLDRCKKFKYLLNLRKR